jgi:hypothetical protein
MMSTDFSIKLRDANVASSIVLAVHRTFSTVKSTAAASRDDANPTCLFFDPPRLHEETDHPSPMNTITADSCLRDTRDI